MVATITDRYSKKCSFEMHFRRLFPPAENPQQSVLQMDFHALSDSCLGE